MLETRLRQILAPTPQWLVLETNPDAESRYQGRYLALDGVPCGLGNLLGQGDEAFVFELINLRDGDRAGVVKICRHPPTSQKYATWAVPYRIEINPHSAIPDVEMHLARLVQVPGGLVKVQPYLFTDPETDPPLPFRAVPILDSMRSGDLVGALRLAQTLIEQHGPRAELLEAKGQVLAHRSRWEEARQVLEQVLETQNQLRSYGRFKTATLLSQVLRQIYAASPSQGATMSIELDDGTIFSQTIFSDPTAAAQDDTLQDRAMYVLLEVLADEPYFIPALLELADTLLESPGTAMFAGEVIQAVEQIDPGSPDAEMFREFVRAHFGEGAADWPGQETPPWEPDQEPGGVPEEVAGALKDFDDDYKPEPTRGQLARARHQSAISHFVGRDLDSAERAAREAIDLDPETADYALTLAEVLDWQGRHEEAHQILQQASTDFFDQASVHERLGDFYLAQEEYGAAQLAYLRALHSEPEMRWPLQLGLGLACRGLGEHQEAIRWLRSAYQESPLEPRVVLGLVYALADREGGALEEEAQEAVEIIIAATSQGTDSAELWVCRAQLQARSGQYAEAIHSLKRAIGLDPDHPFASEFLEQLESWYGAEKRRRMPRRPAIRLPWKRR
jgi:tetratricopeptide (TPR) repeat protein